MPYARSLRTCLTALGLGLFSTIVAYAAPPCAELLPDTTKGVMLTDDVEHLESQWNKTQFGQLMADPVMKPFAEDLRRQIQQKWSRLFGRVGLTMEDLEGVAGGEVAMALVRPAENRGAVAVLADVSDHEKQAEALLAKIDAHQTELGATKSTREVLGASVTTYTLPPEEGRERPSTATFFINDNMLCGSDDVEVAAGILKRFSGSPRDNLASLIPFQAVMARSQESAGETTPELRWYAEPFAAIETMRLADTTDEPKKGKDMLKILKGQGFDAVQGVGGYVHFMMDDRYEMVHRTSVYAPPVEGAAADERYHLAARMLRFPNSEPLQPQNWAPRELATYLSFNWKTREAFDYVGTLVDAVVGEENVWEDVLQGIKEDPNGPQVDIRADLIGNLGSRCTLISDYELPISPKCERMIFAVEATNEAALAKTIAQTMENDPDAVRREFEGHVIYEIVDQQQHELPDINIQFNPLAPIEDDEKPTEEKKKLPNSAVCVANGHLLIATHVEFMKKVLVEMHRRETLANSIDYRIIMAELAKLAPGEQSFQMFSRTDDEYRPTYELIRTGRMPEAETMLGKILNAMHGETKEGEIRQQQIDGSELPEYETVRRYFGPAGLTVRSLDDGWMIVGVLLSKESP